MGTLEFPVGIRYSIKVLTETEVPRMVLQGRAVSNTQWTFAGIHAPKRTP